MSRPLLVLLLAGLLVACGGGSDPSGDRRTLTLQAAGGEGELGALRELVAAFEQSRPEVDVRFVGVPSQGDHIAKLSTAFAGGSPPDVFLLNYRRLGPFVERGVLAPPDLGERSPEDFYAPTLEAFTYEGELACVPQNTSSTVAYLNLDLFEQAGLPLPEGDWTWAQLERTATALQAEGIDAVGFDVGVRLVAPFVWTAGGEIVDDTEQPTAMTLATVEGRRALEYLRGLQAYGIDARTRAARPPAERFAGGELAVFFDSRRAVPGFRKATGLSFDVRPLPRADAERPSSSLLASDAYCVSKASDVPELAAEFAAYAVGPEGATVLARSGRTVPSVQEVATGPAFLDPDQQPASSEVFLDVIPTLRRLPNVGPQDEAEEAADDVLQQYFAGNADLDSTVAEVRRATAAVYGQRS